MTDKQIIIKEITECGFYCSKDDVEHLYIYEVIKNTDEEWLKENPEATLLIDEWIYDYTDYDDRKVYCTGGSLTAVCNDYANCKVYKIEDTKYKIYGNCGQFLIEDKPTYKEQLKAKEQECEKIKNWVKGMMFYTDCSNWFERFTTAFEDWKNDLISQLDQLKAEKLELKKEIKHYKQIAQYHGNLSVKYTNKSAKLKQALQEIKEIANKNEVCPYDFSHHCYKYDCKRKEYCEIAQILQKCEVIDK